MACDELGGLGRWVSSTRARVADVGWQQRRGVPADRSDWGGLRGVLAPNLAAISADLGWVSRGRAARHMCLQLLEAAIGRLVAFYGATGVPDTAKPLSACPCSPILPTNKSY